MMKLRTVLLATLLTVAGHYVGANTTFTKIKQVTEPVVITQNYDYVITVDDPIGEGGSVNIVNTDHAVLIFEKVKPSAAKKYLSKVLINGEAAVDGTNCQLKLYNRGSIVLPYGNSFKPLTVYSEQNFGGDAVNDFGLENSGGYMNTLSATKLNNKIRSFKLKRGYMVTFSTLPEGRGYSRCFIAAYGDVEVSTLPLVLDQKISSYRVFKWYDAGKKQLANEMNLKPLTALNVQSSYDWGQGNDSFLPDFEWVPNHIYEDWPSSSTIGNTNQSPHTKNNNEPRNSADDHPQDLQTILGNWENMMRTGLRLCSPASWDGSDYDNATGFLAQFLDSVDARGWRCDIIDLHCYWPEGKFNNLHNWSDKYKRPIWISEWCWGASWNNNGAFASGVTKTQVRNALQGICTKLNGWEYVERYYYWNGEAVISRLYDYNDNPKYTIYDNGLTPAGEYYAEMTSPIAYNGKYDFVPKTPKQKMAGQFAVAYDKQEHKATLTWYDYNGEYNKAMTVERTDDGGTTWVTLDTIAQKETPSTYTYVDDKNARDEVGYRIHILDMDGTERNTAVIYAKLDNPETGDAITVNGQSLYVGGNILTNGDFSQGVTGWISGTGETLAQPYFQVIPSGGLDGSAYLQAYGNKGANDAASIKTYVPVHPNTYYYLKCDSRNGGSNVAVNVSPDTNSNGTQVALIPNQKEWKSQYVTFNSGENNYAVLSFSMLGAKAQFDNLELRTMFATQEGAQADGEACQEAYDNWKAEVDAFNQKNWLYNQIDSLVHVANAICGLGLSVTDQLNQLILTAQSAETVEAMTAGCEALRAAVEQVMPSVASSVQPQSANFASATGWTTKAGTYKGGDQKVSSAGGKTCWNAWWGGVSASEGEAKTMEVTQTVTGLEEGLYALECKASTEHFCLSDQHGYIVSGTETVVTPNLTYDYWDLASKLGWKGNIWQTLTTPPVYVEKDGSLTIGFKSSKKDAVDNAWHEIGNVNSTGDKREGWWCATDFRLLCRPMLKLAVTPNVWSTICLPYASVLPTGARFYAIAGISADGTSLCLEPLETLDAGQPAIYISEASMLFFEEYGDKVTDVYEASRTNNLMGHFASKRVMKGNYILKDGRWTRLTSNQSTPANTAYISSVEGMPVFDTWTGVALPIDGVPTAIAPVRTANGSSTSYRLDGWRTTKDRGLVIETDGQKARKVIK